MRRKMCLLGNPAQLRKKVKFLKAKLVLLWTMRQSLNSIKKSRLNRSFQDLVFIQTLAIQRPLQLNHDMAQPVVIQWSLLSVMEKQRFVVRRLSHFKWNASNKLSPSALQYWGKSYSKNKRLLQVTHNVLVVMKIAFCQWWAGLGVSDLWKRITTFRYVASKLVVRRRRVRYCSMCESDLDSLFLFLALA